MPPLIYNLDSPFDCTTEVRLLWEQLDWEIIRRAVALQIPLDQWLTRRDELSVIGLVSDIFIESAYRVPIEGCEEYTSSREEGDDPLLRDWRMRQMGVQQSSNNKKRKPLNFNGVGPFFLSPRTCRSGISDCFGVYTEDASTILGSRGLLNRIPEQSQHAPAIFLCPERIYEIYPTLLTLKENLQHPLPLSSNPASVNLKMVLLHELGHHFFPVHHMGAKRFLSEALANFFCFHGLAPEEQAWLLYKSWHLQPPEYSAYRPLNVLYEAVADCPAAVAKCFHGDLGGWASLPKKDAHTFEHHLGACLNMALSCDAPSCEGLWRELKGHVSEENKWMLHWDNGNILMHHLGRYGDGHIPVDLVLDLYRQINLAGWATRPELPTRFWGRWGNGWCSWPHDCIRVTDADANRWLGYYATSPNNLPIASVICEKLIHVIKENPSVCDKATLKLAFDHAISVAANDQNEKAAWFDRVPAIQFIELCSDSSAIPTLEAVSTAERYGDVYEAASKALAALSGGSPMGAAVDSTQNGNNSITGRQFCCAPLPADYAERWHSENLMTSQHSTERPQPLQTAADVYRFLRDEGLMLRRDGTGRDDALWAELVFRLGFDPDITDLPSGLEARNTTVEEFVQAFLTCFEPFAVMMADICLFMERHGAVRSYHGLAISYQFSEDDKAVKFTLSHFQEFWRSYHKVYERAVFQLWSLWNLRSYVNDLAKHIDAYSVLSIKTERPIPQWAPGQSVPIELQSDEAVLAHANILHELWGSVQRSINRSDQEVPPPSSPFIAGNDNMNEGAGRIFRNQELAGLHPLSVQELAELRELLIAGHQHLVKASWLLSESAKVPAFSASYEYGEPNSLPVILEQYKDLPTYQRLVESLAEELHSILQLPVWKHRWQLYQVWVGLFVLDLLREQGLDFAVHAPDGKLELYEHHPAHIADLRKCKSFISFWAELQTAVTGDSGSVQSIRPDYRLVRSPFTQPKSTLLLVEAKQRISMTSMQLQKLCERYRAGCPEGSLLFVNYDDFPRNDDLVGFDDTYIISRFRPGELLAIDAARNALGGLATMLVQEQKDFMAQAKAEERKEFEKLVESAAARLSGLEFIGGLHLPHKDELIGAIILDFRNASRCLFSGYGSVVRIHVIQFMRANPLAQVWLAGTNRPPVLACNFNYDNDRRGFDRNECDLVKLIGEIESNVQGVIVVFGYSSAVRHLSGSRIITAGYSD